MVAETDSLVTIKNYALKARVTPTHIYKLIKENRITPLIVDGVQFIDISKFPKIPKKK